jgi:S-DNA-T family DNA segregation ATPase FtsK/SpoIIIE
VSLTELPAPGLRWTGSDELTGAWSRRRDALLAVLGRTARGPFTVDLCREGPHALVAGTTGSGKSELLQTLIASLALAHPPDRCSFLLVDYKGGAAFAEAAGLPHTVGVLTDLDGRSTARALRSLSAELTRREAMLAEHRVTDVTDLPESVPLARLVIVVDEFATLAEELPAFVPGLVGIAQRGRSLGVHLVLATQRPSVDVVTGLIKANIPSRVAFMVASAQDSRVILDFGGADKLVGLGDMLYLPGGTSKPRRIQGAFITEKEVEAVVAYCKAQQQAAYQPGVVAEGRHASDDDDGDEDPLLDQAMDIVVRSGLGSTSMLQSKMKVGFSRARRIMDQLEERGVVGPSEGSKPRDVLMTVEELDQLKGREAGYGEIVGE